ncbi:pilus assembly protein PilS, partial [Neisseria gonorrhoeae]
FDALAVYRRGAGLEIPEPSFPTTPQSRNPSFPRRRKSRSVSAGTYRAKRFLEILSPGFPLSRE